MTALAVVATNLWLGLVRRGTIVSSTCCSGSASEMRGKEVKGGGGAGEGGVV
jgi:hypothetical protein